MRNKKCLMTQYLSPIQILSTVKKDFQRQQQTLIIEENLMYLNNSFTNNIQMKQILVDICKAKKDNVKSKELKAMYMLFTQNKANSLIFQKIVNHEIQNTKNQKDLNNTSTSKWIHGLNGIIEEQEQQTQINIKKNTHQQDSINRHSINQKNFNFFQKKRQRSQNLYQNFENNQTEEHRFLMKRIYCRLIQKILVKIAFYTMNHKFLDFLSFNMLELTKILQKIIRRLNNIKDLKFLQEIVLKIFKQNFIIENKIFELLVDEGFIMSIDEFYRVNGVDAPHQDVYERIDPISREGKPKKRSKLTLKQKIAQMRNKKQSIVKQDHIQRINQEINEKYLQCISQIKYILKEEEKNAQKKEKKLSQVNQFDLKSKKERIKRNRNSLSKQPFIKQTPNVVLPPNEQRQQEQKFDHVIEEKKQLSRESSDSEPNVLNYLRRKSGFSPQFSQVIKQTVTSPNKLQRNSAVLSVKFLEFKHLKNHTRKESNGLFLVDKTSQNQLEKIQNQRKIKKNQEIYGTCPISKILKLYETRNADQYSIDDFLGLNISLPKDVQESLKQELLKLQQLYRKTQNNSSSFNVTFRKPSIKQHSISPIQEKSIFQEQFQTQNADLNLIKLEKNRFQKVRSTEKIHSKNYSIFTTHGVKNLRWSGEKAPCENSKLKKIPYIKLKEKEKTTSVLPSSNTFDLIQKSTTCTTNFATKKYSQSEHHSVQDENLQKTISQLLNLTMQSRAKTLNANKIYTKDKSPQKRFVFFKKEVKNQFERRKNRFKTFNSNFMDEIKNNLVKEKQNTFRRTKQIKTSDWKHRVAFSQPVSPSSSPKKEY